MCRGGRKTLLIHSQLTHSVPPFYVFCFSFPWQLHYVPPHPHLLAVKDHVTQSCCNRLYDYGASDVLLLRVLILNSLTVELAIWFSVKVTMEVLTKADQSALYHIKQPLYHTICPLKDAEITSRWTPEASLSTGKLVINTVRLHGTMRLDVAYIKM